MQLEQAKAPTTAVDWPGEHSAHSVDAFPAANCPMPQFVQLVDPVVLVYCPGLQLEQEPAPEELL